MINPLEWDQREHNEVSVDPVFLQLTNSVGTIIEKSENLKKQKEAGVSKKLVGFEMVERGIPRHDYEIADVAGNVVGIVTSGTQSPSMGIAIGMGYVPIALATPDSEIYIRIRNKDIKAKVVKLPFYKK